MNNRYLQKTRSADWVLYCVLLMFLVIQGCGGKEQFQETTSLEEFTQVHSAKDSSSTRKQQAMAMPKESEVVQGDYQLGAGDLLSIKVFESSDLDSEVRVSSRGYINVPLLGDVKVKNLSLAEAEQKIETLYKKDFIHDPHVSVYIQEHVSKQITIVGAVEQPGTFRFVAQRRLLDVLALGQGLRDNAASYAYLTREDQKTGVSHNYMIDLDDLVKNGNMAQNHVIAGGDVIYIPESGQCFVDGAVRKPGIYAIRSNMTVTEAVTLAGGLARWADDDKIKLIRFMGRGQKRQIVSLSYQDMQAGLGDTLYLKDQDVIFAESSASNKLFSGAGFTLGFMGTGVKFDNPER
ncbi:polysaccharide biosynthesis/export family protein [Desulfosediminicola flagellatus]|uniref:polysaccharide biosynthesis/export family protein n=1 Tax=Desulfosediminicola flagellatus TaxID=2569541 RepID=UPI0010ABFF12|nr:polysaccharide biosynthesis/export family protein [Desulfosediminicola flagellatus]